MCLGEPTEQVLRSRTVHSPPPDQEHRKPNVKRTSSDEQPNKVILEIQFSVGILQAVSNLQTEKGKDLACCELQVAVGAAAHDTTSSARNRLKLILKI